MFRFVSVRVLWFWQTVGYAAAVCPLIGQQEFRNVDDIVRGQQLVESRFHEVERVMVLEPLAELGGNFQSINKLVAPRDGVFFFYFLHDVRVTFREDVECELAHRLRTRPGRRDARGDFECAGIALRPRFAHEGKGAYGDTQDENGCFSHFKIVSEMQNQEAEVPRLVSSSERRNGSLLNAGLGLSTLGSVLEHLGELFNLFGILDHADGEHLGGRGLLDFIVQLAGELVKSLDAFAEFLLVLLQQRSFCGGDGLRVGVNLCRVRSLRRLCRWRGSWRILRARPSVLRGY